jgi:hypothetical protein
MDKFNEIMKLTTSMNMDIQGIIFKKVEENMNTKHNKEIDNVEDLKKFMGKCEDIDYDIYDYTLYDDEFYSIYNSKKGDMWLKDSNRDNKFGDIVCYGCKGNIYNRMDNYGVCSYRGKVLCEYNECKAQYIEDLLDTAEEKIKNLEEKNKIIKLSIKQKIKKVEEKSIDTLLLKYDNKNHFKLFSKILLPQFIRDYNKKDNNTKSLNNLYNYFKRVNLDYGLRPHKDNNKYYRLYHKNAKIEDIQVKEYNK